MQYVHKVSSQLKICVHLTHFVGACLHDKRILRHLGYLLIISYFQQDGANELKFSTAERLNEHTVDQCSATFRRVDSRGGPDPTKDMHWGGPKSKGPPQ